VHLSRSSGLSRSKILLMSSEFSARQNSSCASIGSSGLGGSGVEVADSRIDCSKGEAISMVIENGGSWGSSKEFSLKGVRPSCINGSVSGRVYGLSSAVRVYPWKWE
jgi:hypothetical protein